MEIAINPTLTDSCQGVRRKKRTVCNISCKVENQVSSSKISLIVLVQINASGLSA